MPFQSINWSHHLWFGSPKPPSGLCLLADQFADLGDTAKAAGRPRSRNVLGLSLRICNIIWNNLVLLKLFYIYCCNNLYINHAECSSAVLLLQSLHFFLSLLTSQFAQLLQKHIKQAVPLWKLGSNLHRMQISEGALGIHMETSFLYEWYKNSKWPPAIRENRTSILVVPPGAISC